MLTNAADARAAGSVRPQPTGLAWDHGCIPARRRAQVRLPANLQHVWSRA